MSDEYQCRHVRSSTLLPVTTIRHQAIAGRFAPAELDASVELCAACTAAVVALIRHLCTDGQNYSDHVTSFTRVVTAVVGADE